MNGSPYIWIFCGLVVVAGVIWLVMHSRQRMLRETSGPREEVAEVPLTKADALILGDIGNPLLEITPTTYTGSSTSPIAVILPCAMRFNRFFNVRQSSSTLAGK